MESQGVFEKNHLPQKHGSLMDPGTSRKQGVIWGGRSKGALEEYGSRCGGQMAMGQGTCMGQTRTQNSISESLEIRKVFSWQEMGVLVFALAEVSLHSGRWVHECGNQGRDYRNLLNKF